MLGFMLKKPVLVGLAGLAIVTILGLGYRHYTGLQNEVEALTAQSAALQIGLDVERAAVVDLSNVIGDWEESQQELLDQVQAMQDQAKEARDETRRLHQMFAELDFEDMAPAVLDSLADHTTDRLWRLLDDATHPGRYGGSGGAAGEASTPGSGTPGVAPGGLDSGPDGPGADAGSD